MVSVEQMLEAGWALTWMPPGTKGPIEKGWNSKSKCIIGADPESKLVGTNIGIAHAYCEPLPTCAIDIDHFPSAQDWLQTHQIDLLDLCAQPDVVGILSGKKHSAKLLFQLPEPMPSVQIDNSMGNCILEFRCMSRNGKTLQDVLPPSIHPSGEYYRWASQRFPTELPMIPDDLLKIWSSILHRRTRVSNRAFPQLAFMSSCPETPRQIAIVHDALSYIDADCSYELWRNIVWSILSTQWSTAEEIAQTWSMTAPERYNEEKFWRLVNSYMPGLEKPITLGTLFHHAKLGGCYD